MKITLTKAETIDLLKVALVDNHPELMRHAGFGDLDTAKFDVDITSYDSNDYLKITKHIQPTKEK
jgi:hypothetical protein